MKYLLSFLILFFGITGNAYASFLPTTINNINEIVTISGISSPNCYAVYLPETVGAQAYYPYTENCVDDNDSGHAWGGLGDTILGDPLGDEFEGVYHLVLVNDLGLNCELLEYEDCVNDPSYQGVTVNVTFSLQNEPSNTFAILVEEGDNVMTTVTGENMQANVSYAGDTFYKPFLGAGLATLYYLRYWIVALVIIGAVVFFYRRVKLNKV